MFISQQWYRALVMLLSFSFALQNCQSQLRIDEEVVLGVHSIPSSQQNSNAGSELPTSALSLSTLNRVHSAAVSQGTVQPHNSKTSKLFSCGPVTSFQGKCIRFRRVGSYWQGELSADLGHHAYQQMLPVIASPGTDVGAMLLWLKSQPSSTVSARVHIVPAASSPNGYTSVYLGRLGLMGGMEHGRRFVEIMPTHTSVEIVSADTSLDNQSHMQLPEEAFGVSEWKRYFGVDVPPASPSSTEAAIRAWWEDKAVSFLLENEDHPRCVRENHLLTLIPATIDGRLFTLDKLGDLILANHGGYMTSFSGNTKTNGYRLYSAYLTSVHRMEPLSRSSYWLLLPKTILAGSRDQDRVSHEKLVSDCGTDYRLPNMLEVATSLMSHYVKYGKRLYANGNGKECCTYTRCLEVNEYKKSFFVGGFLPTGLFIDSNRYFTDGSHDDGVVCCRKF